MWGREVGQRGSDRCQRTYRQEKRGVERVTNGEEEGKEDGRPSPGRHGVKQCGTGFKLSAQVYLAVCTWMQHPYCQDIDLGYNAPLP